MSPFGALAGALVAAWSASVSAGVPVKTFERVPRERIWVKGLAGIYVAPTLEERVAFETLVTHLLERAPAGELGDEAPGLAGRAGFALETWQIGDTRAWALLEPAGRRRGAGAYFVRIGSPSSGREVVVQAPHVFHDLDTDRIAASLFFDALGERRPRALFTNTLHRYRGLPGEVATQGPHPADCAHNADHLFQAATMAAARALGPIEVVQLHGFDAAGGDEGRGVDASMIVSSGRRQGSTVHVANLAEALSARFEGVRRHPEDTALLGGTRNVQAKGLARVRETEFVHIEMSRVLRRGLARDALQRRRLAEALLGTKATAAATDVRTDVR